MNLKPVVLPFGKVILQTEHGQSISSDNTYLTNKILEYESESPISVLDLGSGNGILSLMLGHYRPKWQITGLEIQSHLVDLARENCRKIELMNLNFILGDLRNWIPAAPFDLIISNPPYFSQNQGRLSPIKEKAVSRHEILCNMTDILYFIKQNLKNSGRSYLIYPSDRAVELEKNTKKVDLNITGKFLFNKNRKEMLIYRLSQSG